MGMLQEFKEFAMKGNVVDMAVGIVIGAAFTGIVTSMVADIFMPLVGAATSGVNFNEVGATVTNPLGEKPIVIAYGKTITTIINFIIVAFCLFLVVKLMNSLKRKQAAAPPAPETATKEQLLLAEIRDLLKQKAA